MYMMTGRLHVVAVLQFFVLQGVSGACPYDFSALGNFTILCSNSSSSSVSSTQIVICCENIYGAAVYAMSELANHTGEMFLTPEEASDCVSTYEVKLFLEHHLAPKFFQSYCPLLASRITRRSSPLITNSRISPTNISSSNGAFVTNHNSTLAATSCNFATIRELNDLLFVDRQSLILNVSHACNQLQVGQYGCQDCQTQLLDAIARLVDATGDDPAACGTAVAIATTSLNPSVFIFQSFYQCALEILNGVPLTDFLNISTSHDWGTAPASAAVAGRPLPVERPSKSSPKRLPIIVVATLTTVVVIACCTLTGYYAYNVGLGSVCDFPHGCSGTLLSASEYNEFPAHLPTEGFYIFHIKELTKATNNFSDALVVGEGSAGTVYVGNLPSGKLVAVKKIVKETKVETFNKEVELLSRIRHPNLTALLGYCQGKSAHLLVYEFMSNGDLGKRLLDMSAVTLSWDQRIKIAIDCAKGLTYLHEFEEGPIIHRDIKPSNILLNETMEAKLSDFGLSKVLECEASHVSTEIKGTTGYLDPEYLILGQLTEASDVYSFGVVLLQLLSGRKAIDGDCQLNRSLVQLALMVMKQEVDFNELIDPRLHGVEYSEKALRMVAQVAQRCIQPRSYDRPSMSEVLDGLVLAKRLGKLVPARPLPQTPSLTPSPPPLP